MVTLTMTGWSHGHGNGRNERKSEIMAALPVAFTCPCVKCWESYCDGKERVLYNGNAFCRKCGAPAGPGRRTIYDGHEDDCEVDLEDESETPPVVRLAPNGTCHDCGTALDDPRAVRCDSCVTAMFKGQPYSINRGLH